MKYFLFPEKRYLNRGLLCLFFVTFTGLHSAMASTLAPLQFTSYLVFPLLLVFGHLVLSLPGKVPAQKYDYIQLGMATLSLAVGLSFTQPEELYYLISFQKVPFSQRSGFTIGLFLPLLVWVVHLFFGAKTSLLNRSAIFWGFVVATILLLLTHWLLPGYTLYFSMSYLLAVILWGSGRLVRQFSFRAQSHYIFALAWGVWLSVLVVQWSMVKPNYWEVPLVVILVLLSSATLLQKQERIQKLYANLHQQVEIQQRDIEHQQITIEEKDQALAIKDKRIVTNKAILEKAGKRLKEKERILKLQNQQITQSIEYARNIQEAILPAKHTLKQLFHNHFLLFRPKDIVSGDFYWCSQIHLNEAPDAMMENFVYQTSKRYIFVAIIDCTGHGVPGAFMSMIGNTLLNEIVNEKGIYNPGEVLEVLHISIRSDLRQEHSGNNDGMDMCLCRLEKRTDGKTELWFAGAKRDLYCLQNKELVVVPGERKSIGGAQKEPYRSFGVHKILLNKQDRIYLATDGLEDMAIGIKTRRSFGTKRLKNFITKYQHLDLDKQYEILASVVDKYNADTEQRDDVLLLGIEV